MMNRRQRGFTLVELLVVMAIIAILAAIVVPNVARYIGRSRATKALGDIKGMELALTKMVADADRSDLNHLFNPNGVRAVLGIAGPLTAEQFGAAQLLYTRTLYALLREGRAALTDSDPTLASQLSQLYGITFSGNYGDILAQDVVKKLGTSYLEDIATDPWGNIYQIWPGPWKRGVSVAGGADTNPIPFRIFISQSDGLPGTKAGGRGDGWTVTAYDPGQDVDETVGYAAPRDKLAFIWSFGANMVSSQAIYGSQPHAGGNAEVCYDINQGAEFAGGGDDVNNWDNGQSYMRFYN